MHTLDNVHNILDLDKSSMNKAIKDLPLQLMQAWEESKVITLPEEYKAVDNIVFAGMGGSNLATHIIKSLFSDTIKKPMELVNEYELPGYVNEKTLVFLLSNSGNTEETLSCAKIAKEKNCKIVVITTGGDLATFGKDYPSYIFDQKYNQTGQPRLSIGYMIMSILAFLSKLDLLSVNESEIVHAVGEISNANSKEGLEIEFPQNPAKNIAQNLNSRIPILIGSEFLSGVVHSFTNIINENAKVIADYHLIPEMNHHLLEGLGYEQNKGALVFLFIDSELYSQRIRDRIDITKTIVEKNNFAIDYYLVKGRNKIIQAFSLLQTASYVGFYMAMLNNIDPSPVPWVTFLKNELKEINQ